MVARIVPDLQIRLLVEGNKRMKKNKKSIVPPYVIILFCVFFISIYFSWRKEKSAASLERLLNGSKVEYCKKLRNKFLFNKVDPVLGKNETETKNAGIIEYSYSSDAKDGSKIILYVRPIDKIIYKVKCDRNYIRELGD